MQKRRSFIPFSVSLVPQFSGLVFIECPTVKQNYECPFIRYFTGREFVYVPVTRMQEILSYSINFPG